MSLPRGTFNMNEYRFETREWGKWNSILSIINWRPWSCHVDICHFSRSTYLYMLIFVDMNELFWHVNFFSLTLFAFMDWFYVSLKAYFPSECGSTMTAWELLTFMDWFYVFLNVPFPSCFVVTVKTLMFFQNHIENSLRLR